MNQISKIRTLHATTQAAEGLPRLKWTLKEFEKLSELGFFGGIDSERERVELLDGEIVPMQAKGGRHEWVRGRLLRQLMRQLPDQLTLYSEPGWRPGGDRYFEPEMIVCPIEFRPSSVPPADVLLLIEVSDSSLKYDEKTKALIYANLGVREYWVIDAQSLGTLVHWEPSADGYNRQGQVTASEMLTPHLAPALSVSLGSLGLD